MDQAFAVWAPHIFEQLVWGRKANVSSFESFLRFFFLNRLSQLDILTSSALLCYPLILFSILFLILIVSMYMQYLYVTEIIKCSKQTRKGYWIQRKSDIPFFTLISIFFTHIIHIALYMSQQHHSLWDNLFDHIEYVSSKKCKAFLPREIIPSNWDEGSSFWDYTAITLPPDSKGFC